MSNKKKSAGLWRGLTSVSASLLAVTVGASAIVDANAAFINTRLGVSSYKIVDTSNGEKTDSTYFKSEFSSLDEVIEAKDALAAEIASEGTVLFKNEDTTLPLNTSSDKVTLWGLNSINPTLGGMIGSSVSIDAEAGQKQYDIQTALTEKGFSLNQDMLDLYSSEDVNGTYGRKGGHSLQPSFGTMYENPAAYKVGEAPESIYTDDVLKSADDTVALVVISRDSSEASDYNPNMTSADEADSYERPLALSDNEKAMIELAKEHSTKVVVLLNTNNPVEIDDLKNDEGIGAIVWAGEPGANGFLGVADVLSGEVNPSGHIADTYAVNSTSAPAMVNYGVYLYTNNSQAGSDAVLTEENKADWYLVESEGIYTGYKYYETRYEDEILGQGNADTTEGSSDGAAWDYANEVSYPFGYGLTDSNLNHTGIYLYSKGKIMIHLTFDYKTDEKCTTPGQYLKYHRTFQGLSTRELAEKVGIVPATLVLYENDRHPIKHSTAVALANALGIDRNRLLDKYTAFVDYPYSSLLKKVRQDLSLTQIQMAELIGIGQTSYSGWEREIRVPRRKEYDKILAALEKLRVNVDTYLCQSASI